jgi:chaperone required for assembly of F1-ATPase
VSWGRRRRFWQAAAVRPETAGFGVILDGQPLRTPAGAPLVVPTAAFAAAIAAEWDDLETEILPDRLPFTRAANSAIDQITRQRDAVIDAIAAYGQTDLLCYRADGPGGLIDRQAAAWDPWLDWSAGILDAPLVATAGVMHMPQPETSLAALREAVAAEDSFGLTALHELVSLSGSLVLGLAVARGALDANDAWTLSRIDEAWQAEQWGLDDEAEAAAEIRRGAFLRARDMFDLLR